jgi:hypothetical protein
MCLVALLARCYGDTAQCTSIQIGVGGHWEAQSTRLNDLQYCPVMRIVCAQLLQRVTLHNQSIEEYGGERAQNSKLHKHVTWSCGA